MARCIHCKRTASGYYHWRYLLFCRDCWKRGGLDDVERRKELFVNIVIFALLWRRGRPLTHPPFDGPI